MALLPACNSAGGAEAGSPSTRGTAAPSTQPAWVRPATQPDFHVDPKETITYLASDELRGRLVGSPGIDRAADLIASDFAKLGLQPPPGQPDYFQRFKTPYSVSPDPKTSIAPGAGKDWAAGLGHTPAIDRDFVPLGFTGERAFDAPVAFVGYGTVNKDHAYDDYSGIDVGGRVVLAMRYEPHDAKGQSRFTGREDDWTPGAALTEKAKQAAAHGAVALLLVTPPTWHADASLAPFERSFNVRSPRSPIPVMQVSREVADGLLSAGGAGGLESAQRRIDEAGKPSSVLLRDVTVRGNVMLRHPEAKNVVAILPGQGPRADEYVVIGAHYDHLGRGIQGSLSFLFTSPHGAASPHTQPATDQAGAKADGPTTVPSSPTSDIHHGADDNASGTTAVLMLAERFSRPGAPPPARTLVFVTFTAEEEGLIGSEYFVSHPPIPLDKVVAMFNLDMVGRLSDESLAVGGMGTAANFEQLVRDADAGLPLKVAQTGRMTGGKGGMGPSDHMSFALKKIPVLFFFTGTHVDYHRPTDTADKINYDGLGQVVELSERVIRSLAVMPRQEYVSKYDFSAFALAAKATNPPTTDKAKPTAHPAALGLVPDYAGQTDAPGVKISGTVPGSPAAAAGLQPGDVITWWNEVKLEDLQQLSDLLAKAKPGDKVRLVVQRGGKPVTVDAVLAERRVSHD